MRTEPRATGFLIALAVMGCGAPIGSEPAAEPTPAVRPSVPDGWSTVTSDAGDLEIAVPPDFEFLATAGGILAQPPIDERAAVSTLEIWAQGPALIEQPNGDESLDAWLERTASVPRAGEGGVTAVADRIEQDVMLPSGPAVQIAITAQPGTPDESRVVVYVIETADGVGILRFVGFPPERLDERVGELALVARLVRFGSDVGD